MAMQNNTATSQGPTQALKPEPTMARGRSSSPRPTTGHVRRRLPVAKAERSHGSQPQKERNFQEHYKQLKSIHPKTEDCSTTRPVPLQPRHQFLFSRL
jgi:hypothetical protein